MSIFRQHFSTIENRARLLAITEGVAVMLILGSTLVFVKLALVSMGPLTIAAFRYVLAFLLLFPFILRRGVSKHWSSRLWFRFFLIGLSFYVVGNGFVFLGLKYIPATTGSLLLSMVPLLVLFAGIFWLKEIPTRWQLSGVLVGLTGSVLFFSPGFRAGELPGIGIFAIGLLGNAAFGILGREVARDGLVDTLSLTAIPLAFGAVILLPLAFLFEGWPGFSLVSWSIVLLLAMLNTACVYTLYNHALRVLKAFEMSIFTNLTPLVTALLAWLLLGEQLSLVQIIGIVIVIIGVVLVQWGRKKPEAEPARLASSRRSSDI